MKPSKGPTSQGWELDNFHRQFLRPTRRRAEQEHDQGERSGQIPKTPHRCQSSPALWLTAHNQPPREAMYIVPLATTGVA